MRPTNRDAVATKEPPASVIVLGGGAIGLELAQVFARFSTRVTVVEALDRLLPMEEPESSELVAEVLRAEDPTIRTGTRATGVRHDSAAFTVTLDDGTTPDARQLGVGC